MFEGGQRRARREHPAGKQASPGLARKLLVNFQKRGILGPVLGRAALAVAHQYEQFAEGHGAPDRRLEARHAGGDLVEPLDDCGRLARHLGPTRAGNRDQPGQGEAETQRNGCHFP